jgi:hypothetical protein
VQPLPEALDPAVVGTPLGGGSRPAGDVLAVEEAVLSEWIGGIHRRRRLSQPALDLRSSAVTDPVGLSGPRLLARDPVAMIAFDLGYHPRPQGEQRDTPLFGDRDVRVSPSAHLEMRSTTIRHYRKLKKP